MQASDLTFEEDGAEIISGAVSLSELAALAEAFETHDVARPGRRATTSEPAVGALVRPQGAMGRVAQRYAAAGETMQPVRVVLFDKTAAMNWAVPWHQDRTIAVAARHAVDGFDHWNRKDGVDHVEPPAELLSRMLTLRLHLDETSADNGALDILPGSHRLGRVPSNEVAGLAQSDHAVACAVRSGDILAMRLTTIHKSERSTRPGRRRVLHVDYSPDVLPPPLRWHAL